MAKKSNFIKRLIFVLGITNILQIVIGIVIGVILLIVLACGALIATISEDKLSQTTSTNSVTGGIEFEEGESDGIYGDVTVDISSLPEWLKIHVKAYELSKKEFPDNPTPIQIGIGQHIRESNGKLQMNDYDCCVGPMQIKPGSWNTRWKYDGDGDGVYDIYNPHDAIPAAYLKVLREKYDMLKNHYTGISKEAEWITGSGAYLGINGYWPRGSNSTVLYKKLFKALDVWKEKNGSWHPKGLNITIKEPTSPTDAPVEHNILGGVEKQLIADFTQIYQEMGVPEPAYQAKKNLQYSGAGGTHNYGLTSFSMGQKVVDHYKILSLPKKPTTRPNNAGKNPLNIPQDINLIKPNEVLPTSWNSQLTPSRWLTLAVAKDLLGQTYSQSVYIKNKNQGGKRTAQLRTRDGQFYRANITDYHSDCSSLVSYAIYQTTGLFVGSTTWDQEKTRHARDIKPNELKAGDFIVWNNGSGQHVVMFTGKWASNGRPIIIHSPRRDKTVEIVPYTIPAGAKYRTVNAPWVD